MPSQATLLRAGLHGLLVGLFWAVGQSGYGQSVRIITDKDLRDKLNGYWLGQLVGNYMGYPFENLYDSVPVPVFVDRYYFYRTDHDRVRLHDRLRNGYTDILAEAVDGAFSDDDTDIELVTLHGVEMYGLGITYPQMTSLWKKHINRRIWAANAYARKLMDRGLVAPATGSKANNPEWFQIDPQLVNEIWGAFYPGMTRQAARRSEWGARITSDDWGTHPTIAYGILYSAAFFEKDPNRLVQLALAGIPHQGPFYEGMQDVIRWHHQYPDWHNCRQRIKEKYYRDGWGAHRSIISSLQNGLCGIMALLYGEGDFTKTVGIAVTAGFDCDNQAATCGGLIAIMHGAGAIPYDLTHKLSAAGSWDKPFNDHYVNYTRDGLPISNKISDIINRLHAITTRAILANGGHKTTQNGQLAWAVKTDL